MKTKQYVVFPLVFLAVFLVNLTGNSDIKDNTGDLADLLKKLVDTHLSIAELYSYEGRLEDAIRLLEDSLERFKGELRLEDRLRLQVRRARMYLYKGSLDNTGHKKVSDILASLAEPAGRSADKTLQSEIIHLRGIIAYFKGMDARTALDTARVIFTEALALRKSTGDKRGEADTLFYIGCTFQNKNQASKADLDKALGYFQQSYEMADSGDFKRVKAFASRHIAYIYFRGGDLDRALEFALESLRLRKETGLKIFLSPQYLAVGMTYFAKKDLDSALKYTRLAVQQSQAVGFKPVHVQSLMFLGDLLKSKKEYDEAVRAYQKALTVAKSIGLDEAVKRIEKKINGM
jgi:tetratricopeptide (TPR) repeat protein